MLLSAAVGIDHLGMADVTLSAIPFAVGTTLSVFPYGTQGWERRDLDDNLLHPLASPVTTAVVVGPAPGQPAENRVTFSGLTLGTKYVYAAIVDDKWQRSIFHAS